MWVRSLGQEDALEKEQLPTPIFLPGKFHGQRTLAGYSPADCKDPDTTDHTHTSYHQDTGGGKSHFGIYSLAYQHWNLTRASQHQSWNTHKPSSYWGRDTAILTSRPAALGPPESPVALGTQSYLPEGPGSGATYQWASTSPWTQAS